VLAHELGHFRNRDHLRGLGRGVAVALLMAATSAAGGGEASRLVAITADLSQRSYGRDKEADADAFALGLLFAEYGHVAGASDFFQRLPDPTSELGKRIESYLSTHPIDETRVQALEEIARAQSWPVRGQLTPLDLPES